MELREQKSKQRDQVESSPSDTLGERATRVRDTGLHGMG